MKTARFATTCSRCQQAINVGERIKWARRGPEHGRKVHFSCNRPEVPATPAAPAVPAVPEVPSTPLPPVLDVTVVNGHIANGRIIEAIKYVRSVTQWSLVDSKNFVDKLRFAVPEPKEENNVTPKNSSNELTQALETLGKYIPTTLNEGDVRKIVEAEFAKLPKSEPVKIEIVRSSGEVKRIDNAHAKMPQLMYLLSKNHHVYLYGGPGSGKSTAAKMAADGLGVAFGYISLNPQTPDSRLMGYMDANGNYRETLFHKLYRDGGVFCIDEMDNASASLLTTLNSCLENGHGSFPNGMVERHKDFVVVATGNTAGRGANPMFPDRRPFDAAFSERFTFIEWDYDTQLEESITMAINPDAKAWLNWIRSVRAYAKMNHPKLIVSPRASFRGAEYLIDSKWDVADIAEAVLFKGIDKDTKAAILNAHPVKAVR